MLTKSNLKVLSLLVLVPVLISIACGGSTTVGNSVDATVANPTLPPKETASQAPTLPAKEITVSTPSPTVSPIPLPTSTATPSVPSLEVVAGRDYISYDYLHVVGEVINNTGEWFDFVEVVATFYDSDNKVLGSDFSYIALDKLPPHGKGVFDLVSDVGGAVDLVASYKLQVQGNEGAAPPYQDLDVRVDREYSEYDYYHLVGEVENVGDLNCEFTEIIAGFYNADGVILAVDFTYAEMDLIPAGGSSPFDLVTGDLDEGYDHYEVWVQCQPSK